jgi:Pyruvate/2-oxoacid:ferredoxin oxidoreductase delta subunit
MVIPRLGYCEYNCTLCGQVCPTGAIPSLPVEAKKCEVIGKAVFDKNHCLPFARKIDCIVCEEHCPIPEKAIRSRITTATGLDGISREVKEPYIVEEICNGCGICENVCPLETKSGIEIFAVKNRSPISHQVKGSKEETTGTYP